jgi:hypothetical protein
LSLVASLLQTLLWLAGKNIGHCRNKRYSVVPICATTSSITQRNEVSFPMSAGYTIPDLVVGLAANRAHSELLLDRVAVQDMSEARTMSKRIDFAKERRDQGRLLNRAVHELAALVQPIAQQNGIDLHARLSEAAARKSEARRLLAARLQESVVPLFIIHRGGPPDRIGSCVLVRLDSDFLAFTAAHVIRDAASAPLFAPAEGRGGKLLPLPPYTVHLNSSGRNNDLDIGVLFFATRHLGSFQRHVFLTDTEIDKDDRADDQSLKSFYFVVGYSGSRTQLKVSKAEGRIHQQSFHCATSPVDAEEYLQEQISRPDHILLDFDHKEIVAGGKRVNPPKLQGVSGGGIFHISRETQHGPLVAIATQNRRNSRLIVGTRIKHFLAVVRELKRMPEQAAGELPNLPFVGKNGT